MNSKGEHRTNKQSEPALQFYDIPLKTGIRLRYAEQGDPLGQPIILLHGYTDSWFSYSRVLPLINKKYRVFVLDQRGHGDSDRPAEYGMPILAADVLAFMDTKGLQSSAIVGHSMGSFVAQHVAVKSQARVSHLVLIGSAITMRNDVIFGFQKEIDALRDPIPSWFVREFQTSTVFQTVPDEFMERAVNESMKLPASVWRLVMAGMLASDAQVELSEIVTPVLIAWGDQDLIFSRSEQDALVSSIPNPVFKIYVRAGHAPHWEQPEQFARDLEDFMAHKAR